MTFLLLFLVGILVFLSDIYIYQQLWKLDVHFPKTNGRISIIPPIWITIAISIYNKKSYLDRCLCSSLNQTDPNYQVVFIDDGSTDGTFDYLVDKTKFDSRVTIVKHIYNKGLIHARISGVRNSEGMYILSYDPDDVLYPDSIKGLHHYIKKYNYMADVLEFIQNTQFKKKMVKDYLKCKKNYSNPNELVRDYSTMKMSHNVCKRLIRRDIYLKALDILYPFVKGKRYIYCEDRLQVVTIFALTLKFYCVDVEVYHYYAENPDSSGTKSYQPWDQTSKQARYAEKYIKLINNVDTISKIQKGENLCNDFIKKNQKYYNEITNIKPVVNKSINLTIANKYFHIHSEEEEGVIVLRSNYVPFFNKTKP